MEHYLNPFLKLGKSDIIDNNFILKFLNETQHEIHRIAVNSVYFDYQNVREDKLSSTIISNINIINYSFSSQEMEKFFEVDKNTYLCLASIMARKDKIYDEVKQGISGILLKNVTLQYIEDTFKHEEIDYFSKCLVVALNSNDNPFIRQNMNQLIANLLIPMWAISEDGNQLLSH